MNNKIKIHDYDFSPYILEEELQSKVKELASQINTNYDSSDPPIILALLNGAFMFAADLCRSFNFNCELQLLKVKSYDGMQSTGNVIIDHASEPDMKSRRVLIIEDIVDTGNTLAAYLPTLEDKGATSIEVCTLLSKPNALKHDIKIDYTGFEIPNDFVIGYGLDYNGIGRNLPCIYKID